MTIRIVYMGSDAIACRALEQLSVLMDGVDEGRVLKFEADMSDSNSLTAELMVVFSSKFMTKMVTLKVILL